MLHAVIGVVLCWCSSLRAASVVVKRLLSKSCAVVSTADDGKVQVAAMYCNSADIACAGAEGVSVNTLHGTATVLSTGPVTLSGVNGSVTAMAKEGDVAVHFDTMAPQRVSALSSVGDVRVSVSPPVVVDLDVKASGGCSVHLGAASSFTTAAGEALPTHGSAVAGLLRAVGDADDNDTRRSSGKISQAGRLSAAAVSAAGGQAADGAAAFAPASLTVRADETAEVRELSWMAQMESKLRGLRR